MTLEFPAVFYIKGFVSYDTVWHCEQLLRMIK